MSGAGSEQTRRRRASRGAFQSAGETKKHKKLKKPHETPRVSRGEPAGMKRGTFPGRAAGSAFQHRHLKGEGETKNTHNHSDPQRKRGPRCRLGAQGPVGTPRRRVRRTPRSARQGPEPSARRDGRRSAAPGAQGSGPAGRPGSAGSAARAAAPGSLPPAGGAFPAGRAPRAGPGGGVAISAKGNGARGAKVLREKGGKNRLKAAPRAAIRLPPGHAVPGPLGWALRALAAVPDAPVTSRGRDSSLRS